MSEQPDETETTPLEWDDVLERLSTRRDGLLDWLRKDHPECGDEQKHLDEGSIERAYWHYGYMVALGDTLRLLDRLTPRGSEIH